MAYSALIDGPVPPMLERVSAWSIYRIFETEDGDSIFAGVTSDRHWQRFCEVFERPDWAADASLATHNGRIDAAERLLPAVEAHLKTYTKPVLIERCEAARLFFAPIAQPEDLFNDLQLHLVPTTLPDGTATRLPRVPLEMGDYDFGLRHHPLQIGSATHALLTELGYSVSDIQQLKDAGKLA